MLGTTPIGISIALAVLAIGVLALVAIRWRRKPKQRAEKWEKGEIMKQLLALSEHERSVAVKGSTARGRASSPKPRRSASNIHVTKAALSVRSKKN